MPDLLHAVALAAEDLHHVRGLDYGQEPQQLELSQWLDDEAAQFMSLGTRVWMYVDQNREIVGYGSLGTTNWRYPDLARRGRPSSSSRPWRFVARSGDVRQVRHETTATRLR